MDGLTAEQELQLSLGQQAFQIAFLRQEARLAQRAMAALKAILDADEISPDTRARIVAEFPALAMVKRHA